MKGLVLVYIVTGVASLGALRYPLIGLYAYVGFAVLRPQFIFGWAGDLSGISQYVGVAMLIGWAFQLFGSWRFERGRLPVLSLLVFAVWFAISGVLALNPEGSWYAFLELTKTLLPLLVGITLMKEPKHWRRMLWVIVLCQGYVGFEMHLDYLVKGYNTANAGFDGADNNFFGLKLVTTLGPAVALAIASRTWVQRLAASVCAALILHTTLLTFSRGAMLGLIAVLGVAFVMMPKRPKNMAAVAAVAVLAVWLTGPELASRFKTTFAPADERDYSAESRIELWRDCLLVIAEYPVFGVGPWNWSTVAVRYGWAPSKSAHSVWMETAAETGIPGALFLALFFGSLVARLWPIARARRLAADDDEPTLAAGIVLSITGFAVTGQFVSATNLELAYYVAMVGVAVLKLHAPSTAEDRSRLGLLPRSARQFVPRARPLAPVNSTPRVLPARQLGLRRTE